MVSSVFVHVSFLVKIFTFCQTRPTVCLASFFSSRQNVNPWFIFKQSYIRTIRRLLGHFLSLFCWVIGNTEEFQKHYLLSTYHITLPSTTCVHTGHIRTIWQLHGHFASFFVGSFGTQKNSRNATYLPHYATTYHMMKRQNGGMVSERQNDRTNYLQKNNRVDACTMAGIATYLPHLLYTAELVPTWTIYGTHTTTTTLNHLYISLLVKRKVTIEPLSPSYLESK